MISTTLKNNILIKYINNVFVETGTCEGGGVNSAIMAGFKEIYSIEINTDRQAKNLLRFEGISHVHLITGDSGLELKNLIPQLRSPATFWLDAHFEKKRSWMRTRCPLYEELDAIAHSPIKNHTIMIDDMRVVGNSIWGKKIVKDLLIEKIMLINKDYKISYEDNTIAENDIMVATVGGIS